MPSLVAEIGCVLEEHLLRIGAIEVQVDEHMQAFIAAKKEAHGVTGDDYPDTATICAKCGEKAVVVMDKCPTCLACGDSKCG